MSGNNCYDITEIILLKVALHTITQLTLKKLLNH